MSKPGPCVAVSGCQGPPLPLPSYLCRGKACCLVYGLLRPLTLEPCVFLLFIINLLTLFLSFAIISVVVIIISTIYSLL